MKKSFKEVMKALLISLVVFVFLYLLLINQPRISTTIVFPIMGMILFIFETILCIASFKELKKTRFHGGLHGTPEKLITTGPYGL